MDSFAAAAAAAAAGDDGPLAESVLIFDRSAKPTPRGSVSPGPATSLAPPPGHPLPRASSLNVLDRL